MILPTNLCGLAFDVKQEDKMKVSGKPDNSRQENKTSSGEINIYHHKQYSKSLKYSKEQVRMKLYQRKTDTLFHYYRETV